MSVEEGDEGSDAEAEDEADEDETDLDLAWKMLDVARAIAEKQERDTMEKVDILSALAEVSMERGKKSHIRLHFFPFPVGVLTFIISFCYSLQRTLKRRSVTTRNHCPFWRVWLSLTVAILLNCIFFSFSFFSWWFHFN